MLRGANFTSILELCLLSCEALLYVVVVTVIDVAVLDAAHIVGVFLWENFTVLYRLDGGVMVILVDFAVDCCAHILVSGWGNFLMLNSWVHGLVNGCVMLSVLVKEVSNSCLCLFHCD